MLSANTETVNVTKGIVMPWQLALTAKSALVIAIIIISLVMKKASSNVRLIIVIMIQL